MALLSSILTGGVNNHPTTSEEANAWSTDFISEGIVGSFTSTNGVAPTTGAFACNAQGTPDMTIAVSTGVAYVQGTPTSQNSQTFRIKNTATENVTISANSSGSTKYDWVYIKLDAAKLNGPNVAGDDAATLVTSRSTSQSTDDGTPPTYGYPIAVVTVANGAVSITNGNIRDSRANCIVNLGSTSVSSGWNELGLSPNTVTALGNKNYSVVFNSTDLTSTISNGMRLKLPRAVTPPTQCTDLEASSSQYYSKSSPAGMTGTDNYTWVQWVKPTSYTTGTIQGRMNTAGVMTDGWKIDFNNTGAIGILIRNGGANNYRNIETYQSLPINKWSHLAVTWASGTVTMYIDGVSVPVKTATTSGTAPTAWVSTGDYTVGRGNSTENLHFPGKLAQVGVFSSVLNATSIKALYSQGLTGSETNIISGYSFNNTINDLSANANNLTAQNSAVATNVDSPFNSTEYAVVLAAAFSTDTTLTVRVPDGYSLPTSGGVSAVSYSTQHAPYGFPGISNIIGTAITQQDITATPGAGVYGDISGMSLSVYVPSGRSVRLVLDGAAFKSSSAAAGSMQLALREGTTEIKYTLQQIVGVSYNQNAHVEYTFTPTAGAHTYIASYKNSGSGNCVLAGAVGAPSILTAEIVGGL